MATLFAASTHPPARRLLEGPGLCQGQDGP